MKNAVVAAVVAAASGTAAALVVTSENTVLRGEMLTKMLTTSA